LLHNIVNIKKQALTNYFETMTTSCQHMTMEDLVDILAQKTQIFTQMLVEKKFDDDYKQVKEEIQKILAEIDNRRENPVPDSKSPA